jgi:hypothetical protein
MKDNILKLHVLSVEKRQKYPLNQLKVEKFIVKHVIEV